MIYNIKAPTIFLEVLKLTKSKIIVTSTSEVYGTAKNIPITEDHILQPQSLFMQKFQLIICR